MNELRYQLDLMRAMNQKLSAKERMYRLLCDTMVYAEGKEDLAAVFQQDFLRRWQADGSDYCGTEYHQTENTERRASLHGVLRQSDWTVQP